MDPSLALNIYLRLRNAVTREVFGRDSDHESLSTIDLILVALFTGGHVLLEDYPGSGKSYLAEKLGRAIRFDLPVDPATGRHVFRRIQCTPDLLPTDLIGYVDAARSFHPGPVFSTVLLVDELNRTTPKVQSALLEAMAERQVTVENLTYPLNDLFFVIATQNPLDRLGTYELPAAQLDRFLFKRNLKPIHPDFEALVITLDDAREHARQRKARGLGEDRANGSDTVSATEILQVRAWVLQEVDCHPHVVNCMLEIADRLTTHFGAERVYRTSPRSNKSLYNALKMLALISCPPNHTPRVQPEDLAYIARDFYVHRLGLSESELSDAADAIEAIVTETVERFKFTRK